MIPGSCVRLFAERASVGDLERVLCLYEDGATLVAPDSRAAGGGAVRERLQQLLAMTPRITGTSTRAVVVGDIALMSNDFQLDKVTVAAVDGFAVGGGLEITMACDFVIATSRARWGMPEVDVGITPGWGGTTRMTRLIGRRMTKEINLLGALHPASRAVELGLWNRVVPDGRLAAEADALVRVLLSKNQQAVRQLKFIIDKGSEADLNTAQGFEALSAGLSGAVNGAWQVPDADQASGIMSFIAGGEQWQHRRTLAREFWTDAGRSHAQ